MKLQFGILYRDERVANRQDLETLLGEYASYNVEISGQFFDGPLLMVYRGDRITWEEDNETQPFSLGPYTITFDGRLDNREDIAAKIGIVADSNLPDPVLILQAYEKYGDSLLLDLIGEFAFVVWDCLVRRLLFVRSEEGSRPLFYIASNSAIIWCSNLAYLLKVSRADQAVNDRYILQFLLRDPPPDETPFRSAHAVNPGTIMSFDTNNFVPPVHLWNPLDVPQLKYRSDTEYEEHFRHVFREAVEAKLRAKNTIFAELSGGLDSSSIVLQADDLIRSHGTSNKLRTISTVYEKSRTCDERHFIKFVEEKRGMSSIYVGECEQAATVEFDNPLFTGLLNTFDNTPGRFPRFIEHMRDHDSRLLLTGVGGDHLFNTTPYPELLVADVLQSCEFREAHWRCRIWSQHVRCPYLDLMFAKALPLAVAAVLPRRWWYEVLRVPKWLAIDKNSDIFQEVALMKPQKGLAPSHVYKTALIGSLFRTISSGHWNNYPEIYISHPYTYRPLVSFSLATPLTQFQRDGQTRSLVRRALSNLLPTAIVRRKGKGDISEFIARAVAKHVTRAGNVANWQVCLRGFVKPKELSETLRNMKLGLSDSDSPGFPLHVITVERFLRQSESGDSVKSLVLDHADLLPNPPRGDKIGESNVTHWLA